MSTNESVAVAVIGGGQAGLAAGYFLTQQGKSAARQGDFVILDEHMRTGDSWRLRWDSLRLFTPSKYNGLPGKPFPRPDFYFPTKDEVADYLETYAQQFKLPVRHRVEVQSLARSATGYQITTSEGAVSAGQVIVATGAYQKPYTPAFAQDLDPSIFQIHSSRYCNPAQVPVQNVLVVGAGNSGAEIALDLARAGKQVWLSGRDVGRIPADRLGRVLDGRAYWFFISRVLNVKTPMGRKMRSGVLYHGAPLIGTSREAVTEAGVQPAARVTGVHADQVTLEDGRGLPVEGIIWATGFRPDYHWIDLPIFDDHGYPRHQRGTVQEAPGLYFLGLPFQSALSSALLGGVGEDAAYIVRQVSRS